MVEKTFPRVPIVLLWLHQLIWSAQIFCKPIIIHIIMLQLEALENAGESVSAFSWFPPVCFQQIHLLTNRFCMELKLVLRFTGVGIANHHISTVEKAHWFVKTSFFLLLDYQLSVLYFLCSSFASHAVTSCKPFPPFQNVLMYVQAGTLWLVFFYLVIELFLGFMI